MTEKQRQTLFMYWDLYDPNRKKLFIAEYFLNCGEYSQKSWLDYLKENLDFEGCWSRVGQA
ncbi:MAG: hypothetical protein ACWGOX_14215 [Desulforhopalus sp.]